MADKSFGVDQLDILGTGTPTISAPNQLNLDAHTVAISTSVTVGEGMSAVNISATGISTIAQPANSNPMANWTITNNSASAYRFTGPGQSGSDDNPDLYLVRGHRYIFKHNATTNHPIQIRVASGGAAYTDGITYSDTSNNRTTDGNNLIINLQHDAPARLFYQCTSHGSMVGNIYTVGGPQVISGVVTATTFVGNLTGNPTGSGANLTNLPAANLTGTLPAISGANLTNLPAQATIANNADDRVITGGSGVNLNGEANLTFNGNALLVNNTSSNTAAHFKGASGAGFIQITDSDDSSTAFIGVDGGTIKFQTSGSSYSDKLTIDSSGAVNITGGNLQVGTDSATLNFTNSNSTGTKFIEIGATGANSDSLLVVHSSGYGLGYFGFDAANDRLIVATDAGGGGGHKIAFCLDAGTSTGGGSDNIGGATPALEIDNQKNINVGGIGTFGGLATIGYNQTYSPIQQAANTYFYTRADQATSVSGSNIQNLATGAIKTSETIPISNMTRQSDAGAHSFYNSSATSGSVTRNMSSGNPFHPKAYGLTMGTMFRAHTSGNNGSGVIHYGWTPTNHHFFVRYKYSSNSILVGVDTDGSDNWSTAYQNDLMSDNNWYFFVVAVERNGTLLTSLNGAPLTPIRMLGTAPEPTDARFGLAGDGYTDNDSRHRYATAFWYRGVISNELIAHEYAWLKTIWTGASLP